MKEIWKDIGGYKGLYQISNIGRVRSLPKIRGRYSGYLMSEKIMKLRDIRKYKRVTLRKNGKCKSYFVHRLVAFAFINNPLNKPFINHIDGSGSNNVVKNLEWCTQSENIQHSYDKLGKKTHLTGKYGSNHPCSKKILCFDLNNKFIASFESISEAGKKLNIKPVNITGNLIGHRKTTSSYIFKYK